MQQPRSSPPTSSPIPPPSPPPTCLLSASTSITTPYLHPSHNDPEKSGYGFPVTKESSSSSIHNDNDDNDNANDGSHGISRTITADDPSLFPEGGTRAWLSVLGSFVAMTASFGLVNTIGTLQAWLSENQLKSYSPGAIGWIFSVWTFLIFLAGLQVGPIFDARGAKWLVGIGSVLLVAAVLALGWCTAYWHFMLTLGVLTGIGGSLIFTPAMASVGHFFLRRRGNATGLAATGGSIGGIIFPLMLQKTLPELGFAWSTRILALIVLVLLIVANCLIRTRPELRKKGQSTLPSFKPFKDFTFLLTTAGVFFVEWGLFIPISYIISYALEVGVKPSLAYQLLAILNVGSFFGRWLPGIMADYCGRFNAMIATVILCIISVFGLWLPAGHNVGMLIAFALIFGFASGSNISLTPVCVGQLCRTRDYGRYYAACYTVVSFGTLTGIPVAGQLVTADHGRYRGLILFTGGCYVAGLICFSWARIRKVGWSLKVVY